MENDTLKRYFEVNARKYAEDKTFSVFRPASLNHPKDNAVMFITEKFIRNAEALLQCSQCVVFWPKSQDVPREISSRHAVVPCDNPRQEYCRFFKDNDITNLPEAEQGIFVDGAYVVQTAKIGNNCVILPGTYIGGEVELGDNCYIGAGVRLVGEVHIGNNVVIRENSVIGADGLSTNRDEFGKALTMPQFGGVVIEDDVQIGALAVIARGAIDNTVIKRGAKIDNSTFISHNVTVGEDTFIVGETIMFGSSSTGKGVLVSGNSVVRDGRTIGNNAIVGMGSVVTENVPAGKTVKGNPAR